MNLWVFLSICVICGVLFAMFTTYLNHKEKLKQLELESLKYKGDNTKTDVNES